MPTSLELLTVRQVAEMLGFHEKTVRLLISSGELPAINISGGVGTGKRWRVSFHDLEQWILSRPTNVW